MTAGFGPSFDGPDGGGSAAGVSETHISVVVFVGDRAYKLKKPVELGFLDFSTRERRERACEQEVLLNRRLAPDVYLGVAQVLGDDGEPCDHLVVMRRMPADRRLATMVTDGDPAVAEHLRDTARLLARFHAEAERSTEIADAASPDAVLALWKESFGQLRPFEGALLDPETCRRIETLVHRYLEGRTELLQHRIRTGRIVDGHGDLQAADIFLLPDGPRILDCIEFCDRFRHGDVLSDAAFLAMDLERLGAPELGAAFLRWYREFSADVASTSLVEHYVAYRAHVRCKVNCLRAAQAEGAERAEAEAEARRLLHTTLRHLEHARVRLVLVGGGPGTGKSTLARALGDRYGWTVLRSDETRKELGGVETTASAAAPYGEGLYTREMTGRVYAELLDRAGTALAAGESVVLDASWSDAGWRRRARDLAVGVLADLTEIRCGIDPDIAAARITARAASGGDASDATPEVARRLAADAHAWPEAQVVDTGDTIEATRAAAERLLGVEPPLLHEVVAVD